MNNRGMLHGVPTWPLIVMLGLVIGCLQGTNAPAPQSINTKTLAGTIQQALLSAKSERAALASSIAAKVRSGELKTPQDQGAAWNDGDKAISVKTNATVSAALKSAFDAAPADKVWDEMARGWR